MHLAMHLFYHLRAHWPDQSLSMDGSLLESAGPGEVMGKDAGNVASRTTLTSGPAVLNDPKADR